MGEQDSEIIEAIRKAFELFHEEDLTFFYKLPFEAECDKDRKLHEVCLNHKLAEKLSARKPFSKTGLYVDIEFNRKGGRNCSIKTWFVLTSSFTIAKMEREV